MLAGRLEVGLQKALHIREERLSPRDDACRLLYVDYSQDVVAALPSFLTSSISRPEAFDLTTHASRSYADLKNESRGTPVLPFRLALTAVSAITKLVIKLGRWRLGIARSELRPEPTFGP